MDEDATAVCETSTEVRSGILTLPASGFPISLYLRRMEQKACGLWNQAELVSQSMQVAIKHLRGGGLSTDIYFSWFWRLGSSRSGYQQTRGLVRARFLVCRQPSSRILT